MLYFISNEIKFGVPNPNWRKRCSRLMPARIQELLRARAYKNLTARARARPGNFHARACVDTSVSFPNEHAYRGNISEKCWNVSTVLLFGNLEMFPRCWCSRKLEMFPRCWFSLLLEFFLQSRYRGNIPHGKTEVWRHDHRGNISTAERTRLPWKHFQRMFPR